MEINDNILHFGLDHLEIYGTFNYEKERFEKLDFDNSNYGEIEDYSFTKNEVPKHKYKIIFTKDNYSLFAYYKGDNNSNSIIKSKDKIVIYSTAFKLLEYQEIISFLEKYFTLEKCFRLDICMDINLDIDEILLNFKEFKTGKEYKKSGKIETRYIGDINRYRNKRQIIRIYNKILDILEKKKHKLYKNYLIEKYVTRIEVEIRSELAKNIKLNEIFDNNILSRIFKNYVSKHTDILDYIDIESKTLFRKKEINIEQYQSTAYRDSRINVFKGHAKGIYLNGYCPVRILIGEGLIQEKTKRFLDNDIVEIIGEIENRLKTEELYKITKRRASNYEKND